MWIFPSKMWSVRNNILMRNLLLLLLLLRWNLWICWITISLRSWHIHPPPLQRMLLLLLLKLRGHLHRVWIIAQGVWQFCKWCLFFENSNVEKSAFEFWTRKNNKKLRLSATFCWFFFFKIQIHFFQCCYFQKKKKKCQSEMWMMWVRHAISWSSVWSTLQIYKKG